MRVQSKWGVVQMEQEVKKEWHFIARNTTIWWIYSDLKLIHEIIYFIFIAQDSIIIFKSWILSLFVYFCL